LAFATVRKEAIRVAHGAAPNVVNVLVVNPGLDELCMQDATQVHVGVAAFCIAHRVLGRARSSQSFRNVPPCFEATHLDERSYRRQQIDRLASHALQRLHHVLNDVLFGATPAGMDGCDSSGVSIGDQNGGAICDANAAGDGWVVGDDGVSFDSEGFVVMKGRRYHVNASAVDLRQVEDAFWCDAEILCCDHEVLLDVARVVADVGAEIERVEGFDADPTATREESVPKTSCGEQP